MKHIFNKYYRAMLLLFTVLITKSIYSLECQNNESYIFSPDKYRKEIIYEKHVSFTDDSLNQAKNKEDTMEGRIRLVKEINGIKIYQYVPSDSEDSLFLVSDSKTPVTDTDLNKKSETDEFKILLSSPYSKLNPIPSDMNLPDGLLFRIQLGVFGKPVANDTFKGLSPVSYEVVDGKIKYYAGIFYSSESAGKALKDIREYGFSDSFLVPFYNGKIISIEKAKEIEYSQIKL
jgi:hypothetical protein